MLIDTEQAKYFLEHYKSVISDFSEMNPQTKNEWLSGRNKMIEVMKQSDGVVFDNHPPEIINGIRCSIKGAFCFLKRYQKFCAMQHLESGIFYGVRSLTTPLETMIDEYSIVNAVLIPYEGMIVSDGLIEHTGVSLGKNYIKSFKEKFWCAKRSGELVL
jgi:hypothetical protein